MALIDAGRFWLPGPTEVHAEVLAAQVRPMIAHRGPDAIALMERLQPGLRAVFGTARPVIVATASASALMEAAVRNGVRRRLLAVVNGDFSARFAEIARGCGLEVDVLEVAWGEAVDPEAVRDRVRRGGIDAVSLAHSETSTGVLNPVDAVAASLREFDDVMLLVDSVTGIGGVRFDADGWNLDMALTGSQKALALPPGLAFGVASERLLERATTLPGRGWYLDLVRFSDNLAKGQTPATPALSLMYALETQLERIRAETLEARFARHTAMAGRCHAFVEELRGSHGVDVAVLAPEGARSPTVTCIRLPDGVAGPEVVARMRDRGRVIGAGYGRLKQTTIRIGHMGDHTVAGLEALLTALGDVLVSA